jgi:hypothetical protein
VAKTKSVTHVSTKIKTITMTPLILVKIFCHGWNNLKQEAAQREGHNANCHQFHQLK